MSRSFSNEESEKLIDLVRNHPALYMVKSKSYQDINLKNKIWKHIATQMERTDAECRAKWKSIRDYYQRKRKENKKPTGSPACSDSTTRNKKMENLRFLDAAFVERRSKSSLQDNEASPSVQAEEIEADEEDDNLSEAENSSGDSQLTNSQCSSVVGSQEDEEFQNHRNKKRKVGNASSERSNLLKDIKDSRNERMGLLRQLVQQKEAVTESGISLFFKSVGATVSTFPVELQAEAKMKIMDIVTGLEIRVEKINSVDPIVSAPLYKPFRPFHVPPAQQSLPSLRPTEYAVPGSSRQLYCNSNLTPVDDINVVDL